ncbi:hypothetical protein KIF24_24825 [Micromonospora sp. Llam7]|uniref:hypothetical protein n=1 Tax=Micromonospora tarapacensis TaxID=2835305 RepID=UPI001C83937E|nr:hypothetical protein [Micromonospora tarapacensis]MBX7268937.1 hypothetical protein [Micromonospora tarapacensis]
MTDGSLHNLRPLPEVRHITTVRAAEFGGHSRAEVFAAATQWIVQNPDVYVASLQWEDKAAHPEPDWSTYILTIYYES